MATKQKSTPAKKTLDAPAGKARDATADAPRATNTAADGAGGGAEPEVTASPAASPPATPPEPEPEPGQRFREAMFVKAKRGERWRGGIHFGKAEKRLFTDDITLDQQRAIEADPALVCRREVI